MRVLIVLAAFAATALAHPIFDQVVSVTQDTLGNYRLGYNILGSSRHEERTADGTVRGFYSYVDPNGLVREVHYIAGRNGFQVLEPAPVHPVAPTFNLVQVPNTPEVAAARADHLVLLEQARAGRTLEVLADPVVLGNALLEAPSQVLEIPDVTSARANQFAAVETTRTNLEARVAAETTLVQIPDTPEVAAAKAEHFAAHAAARALVGL